MITRLVESLFAEDHDCSFIEHLIIFIGKVISRSI